MCKERVVTQQAIRLVVAVLVVHAIAAEARAQDPRPPVVVTTGEAVMRVAPDRAFVSITAESRSRSPQQAQQQNAQAMERVLGEIKALGIAADAIKTTQYELHPEYDYVEGKRVPRGFVARNTVEVRVDDLQKLGSVLDRTVASGATSVGNVRFDIKTRDAVEREALKAAVADARAKAEAAAAGAGMTAGAVVRIEEHGVIVRPPMPMMEMRAAQASPMAAPPPPIEAGELEIRASVTLTVALR
jgi:uncharacterized protein YggE